MSNNNHKVAVFGASGVQGRPQVLAALVKGYQVRAISRNPAAFDDPAFAGVEVVPASYDDFASLNRALEGINVVIAQVPTMGDEDLMRQQIGNLADALAQSDVELIVFNTSMWAPREPCASAGYNFIMETEQMLEARKLPLIFLEPTLFMSNLQGNWIRDTIINEGVFRYCHKPDMEADWVCPEDLAKIAVEALARPDLIGRKFHVGGPERLKARDVVDALSEATGKSICYEYITTRQFAQDLWDLLSQVTDYAENAGNMPRGRDEESYVANIDEFYTFSNESPLRPFLVKNDDVQREFGVEMTTLKDWTKTQVWTP